MALDAGMVRHFWASYCKNFAHIAICEVDKVNRTVPWASALPSSENRESLSASEHRRDAHAKTETEGGKVGGGGGGTMNKNKMEEDSKKYSRFRVK